MCERVSFHSWLIERDLLTAEFILAMALLEWGPWGGGCPPLPSLPRPPALYLISWIADFRSRFFPQTFKLFTSKMTNSPFFMPMATISPSGL